MNRSSVVILSVVGIALFLGLLTYFSFANRQQRLEVCMSYQGHDACATASGPTRDDAIRTAASTACAQIASGMTDSMACEHASPKSVRKVE